MISNWVSLRPPVWFISTKYINNISEIRTLLKQTQPIGFRRWYVPCPAFDMYIACKWSQRQKCWRCQPAPNIIYVLSGAPRSLSEAAKNASYGILDRARLFNVWTKHMHHSLSMHIRLQAPKSVATARRNPGERTSCLNHPWLPKKGRNQI